jgi:hypothetical protein
MRGLCSLHNRYFSHPPPVKISIVAVPNPTGKERILKNTYNKVRSIAFREPAAPPHAAFLMQILIALLERV